MAVCHYLCFQSHRSALDNAFLAMSQGGRSLLGDQPGVRRHPHRRHVSGNEFRSNAVELIQQALLRSSRAKKGEVAAILDAESIAVLLSVLFLPREFSFSLLRQILYQLCAHSKTRLFIVQALLDILYYAGMMVRSLFFSSRRRTISSRFRCS
jgi:hypothetical protein